MNRRVPGVTPHCIQCEYRGNLSVTGPGHNWPRRVQPLDAVDARPGHSTSGSGRLPSLCECARGGSGHDCNMWINEVVSCRKRHPTLGKFVQRLTAWPGRSIKQPESDVDERYWRYQPHSKASGHSRAAVTRSCRVPDVEKCAFASDKAARSDGAGPSTLRTRETNPSPPRSQRSVRRSTR